MVKVEIFIIIGFSCGHLWYTEYLGFTFIALDELVSLGGKVLRLTLWKLWHEDSLGHGAVLRYSNLRDACWSFLKNPLRLKTRCSGQFCSLTLVFLFLWTIGLDLGIALLWPCESMYSIQWSSRVKRETPKQKNQYSKKLINTTICSLSHMLIYKIL